MSKEKNTPPSPPRKVRCSGCCNAVRDTEGISFAIATGEFFMGTCKRKHGYPYKVFMDKARVCEDYNKPLTEDQPANKEQDEDKEEYTEVIKTFFSMLEEKGMTLEEFNKPRKRNCGIAMPTYEAIANKLGISEFTVLRVLQRNGYVPKRKYVLVEDIPADVYMPPEMGADTKPSTP